MRARLSSRLAFVKLTSAEYLMVSRVRTRVDVRPCVYRDAKHMESGTLRTVNALLGLLSEGAPMAAVFFGEARVNPLSALYGAIVKARNGLYDRGALKIRGLQGAVVSIGNLTVGGSGKTPFLITLGELLKERGVAFDVLSRGYGRRTKGVALVDPGLAA